MPKVRLTQKDPAGNLGAGENVRILLIASTTGEAEGFVPTGPYSIAGDPIDRVYLGADGTKDVQLVPNSLISPAGTTYQLLKSQRGRPAAPVSYNISVPVGTFTVDAATNVITSVAHRLAVGDPVRVENAGGTLPGGLAASTDYWVKTVPTADTLTLAPTSALATTVDITGTGTGTHSLIFYDHTLAVPSPSAIVPAGAAGLSQTNTFTGYMFIRSGKPWFDVMAFSAVGDGVTDDTAAVQAAITAAQNAGGGLVFLPYGTYRCSALTMATDGIELFGSGFYDSGTRILATAAGDLLTISAGRKTVVRDLLLEGNNVGTRGIVTTGLTSGLVLERGQCRQFTSHGVDFQPTGSANAMQVVGWYSRLNGGSGFNIGAPPLCNNTEFDRCVSQSNGGDGFTVSATSATTSLRWRGGWASSNTGWGIQLGKATGAFVFVVLAEANGLGGIDDSQSARCTIIREHTANQGPTLGSGSTSIDMLTTAVGHQVLGKNGRGVVISGSAGTQGLITAAGGDTNLDLLLSGKGTGGVRIGGAAGGLLFSGTGSPEGAITATRGSLYLRTDGGVGTTLYVKSTGSGNTGWNPSAS